MFSDISESDILGKIRRRLIPFMFLLYIVSYLDRINVSFAALQLNTAHGFTPTVFGFGAGIFFIGYFFFEVPSNLIMMKTGPRIWMARILISWGIISSATMFVRGPASFYAFRFLLGAAEAGFFPGMILYLTYWFPIRDRGRAVAQFMTATAIAGVIGSPMSGALLKMDGIAGLAGWQWLFLIEGLPALILGFVILRVLPNGPDEASWLSVDEKEWLGERLATDRRLGCERIATLSTTSSALFSGRVWLLCLIYFSLVMGFYGVNFWLPQIVRSFSGANDFRVGWITAIPYLAAAIGMVWIGHRSDRTQERRRHSIVSALIGGSGLVLAAYFHNAVAELAALSLAAIGIWGVLGPFWAMASDFLEGTAAAAGIALINSVGNLGGFAGPYLVGFIRGQTGNFTAGMLLLALMLVICAAATYALPENRKFTPF